MRSNHKRSFTGSEQTAAIIKTEPLSLSDITTPPKKGRYEVSSSRTQRRRIHKKEPYSPEAFAETKSNILNMNERSCTS